MAEEFVNLTPRQEDIYNAMRDEKIPIDGNNPVTRKWVELNRPSTPTQPRKNKKTPPKIKRKKKTKKGCRCK
jgi:hypothetical protein